MSKTVTVTMNDSIYRMFKKLKEDFKSEGKTVTELFKQMITLFYESRGK